MSDQSTILKELQALQEALQAFPEGVLIEEIEEKTHLRLSRRTLQRRLLKLKKIGALKIEGKTRGTLYSLINLDTSHKEEKDVKANVIPLTQEAQKVLKLVSRPLHQRTPIGYNREFLEIYHPNITSYLTKTEIQKLTHLGRIPNPPQAAGTYAKEILSRLLVDLSWNSSRLEGNTYSLLNTQRLIVFGEVISDKSPHETQMILNHKDALEFLVQSAEEIGFNRYTLLNLHALLANNLLQDPSAVGRLRQFSVGISHSIYEPLAVPQLISEIFDLILKKASQIQDPFEQAFFIMVHLPYLQPFDDVNKRVSRLAANIPFIRHNLSPLSFINVPEDLYIQGILGIYELNHIELLRDVFIWAYERSAARYAALRQSLGEPDLFRLRYLEEIRSLIKAIVTQNLAPKSASDKIEARAKTLPKEDRANFIEVVETELLFLHEGNSARYQIRPAQFETWKKTWDHSF